MKNKTITTDDCDTISSAIKLARYHVMEHEGDHTEQNKTDAETVDQAWETLRKMWDIARNPPKIIERGK